MTTAPSGARNWRSPRRVLSAAVLATAGLLWFAGPAAADPATGEEVQALAEAAQDDPQALERLRAIDEVDGRPVDLSSALDTGGANLAERLAELAAGAGTAGAGTGAELRDDAARILGGDRFQPVELPRPLRGVFRAAGDALSKVVSPLVDALAPLLDEPVVLVALGTVAVAVVALVASALGTRFRRAGARAAETGRDTGPAAEDPAEVERAADRAAAAGQLRYAYRLRFRAGLLRLSATGAVPARRSLTNSMVAELVHSPRFERLAASFDEVAYGGRAVEAAELAGATDEWAALLREAR